MGSSLEAEKMLVQAEVARQLGMEGGHQDLAAARGRPSTVARTSTPSPTRSTTGARMNTAGNGNEPPASPSTSRPLRRDYDIYYHRLRGTVKEAKPGDEVRVWFSGGGERSQSFTYTQVSDTNAPVLVMAAGGLLGRRPRVRLTPRRRTTSSSTPTR